MRRLTGTVALGVLVLLSASALSGLAPPRAVLAQLGEVLASPQAAVDGQGADAAVLPLVAALAWFVLGWLVLAGALVAAAALPGRLGALAATVSRLVAPAATRRLLAGVLGVTLVTGLGAGSALAAPPDRSPAPTSVSQLDLDWPATSGRPADEAAEPAPEVTQHGAAPSTDRGRAGPTQAVPGSGPQREVVVALGDTLWSLAARQLDPGAGDAAIAREWPRWWAKNRDVVGPNPHLLLPGQRLVPPDQ